MTQGINLKDSIVLNTMSMFGAPFGIFIAMLVMDKIPRKTMGVGLLILIAVLVSGSFFLESARDKDLHRIHPLILFPSKGF